MTVQRRSVAALLLAAFLGLLVWGIASGSHIPTGFVQHDESSTDVGLYKAIVERMDSGQSYYAAVAVEQPARGYPTSPAMTVREPILAWSFAGVGPTVMLGILSGLALLAVALSIFKFEAIAGNRAEWYGASLLAAAGVFIYIDVGSVWAHDVWAGILIYVGVLGRSQRHYLPTVVALTVAALIRELAAPVLVVMLVLALWRRRPREAIAYAVGLAFFGAFYLWHVVEVSRLVESIGGQSPNWVEFGGWPFIVNAAWFSTALSTMPYLVAAFVVPSALLGWTVRGDDLSRVATAVLLFYVACFSVVGRFNNLYWGALFGALLLPGLVFAPRAIRDLLRIAVASRRKPRHDLVL